MDRVERAIRTKLLSSELKKAREVFSNTRGSEDPFAAYHAEFTIASQRVKACATAYYNHINNKGQ